MRHEAILWKHCMSQRTARYPSWNVARRPRLLHQNGPGSDEPVSPSPSSKGEPKVSKGLRDSLDQTPIVTFRKGINVRVQSKQDNSVRFRYMVFAAAAPKGQNTELVCAPEPAAVGIAPCRVARQAAPSNGISFARCPRIGRPAARFAIEPSWLEKIATMGHIEP